jgi:hypothetical protein
MGCGGQTNPGDAEEIRGMQMGGVCFLARVRPERLDEYRERHTSPS